MSFTMTVRVVDALSPPESVTVYVRVVVPSIEVSTVPVATITEVRSPSSLSVEVAPGSVKTDPCVTTSGLSPTKVITGGVFAGGGGVVQLLFWLKYTTWSL